MRSSSKPGRQHGASPRDGEKRRLRILRQLHIEGNAALRGGKITRIADSVGEVRKFKGGRYEVANDGISWSTTSKKRRASDDAAAAPASSAKRLRSSAAAQPQRQKAVPAATAGEKRKLGDDTAADDADFLAETVQRLKRARVSKESFRQAELRMMLPYLQKLQHAMSHQIARQAPRSGQHRGDAPGAYELDVAAAKAVLRSTEQIDAPVFVKGQTIPIVDPEGDARPIEQIFDWLDMDEEHHVPDLQQEAKGDGDECPQKSITAAEVRERFVNDNQEQQYPWNFPEIPMPTVAESIPDFLRHPSCNLMHDLVRFLQETDAEDICPATCKSHGRTAERCEKHLMTAEEYVIMQQVYRHWLGTLMIAEAGALTAPHFDANGFGTFICCAEGSIGFAWTTNTTARRSGVSPLDRWLYKVLRPGDGVYMPPGTYHLVFRMPGGEQTLGWAPRVLRYCDVERWLSIISLELQNAIKDGPANEDYPLIWRGLFIGCKRLIEQARRRGSFVKFGGERTVRKAEKMLDRIETELQQLL